jgi:hypothetical protein
VEVESIINDFKLYLRKMTCNKTEYDISIVLNFCVSGSRRIVS